MYIGKLDDIVNKYNNTCSTIKMKPINVTSYAYFDFNVKKVIRKILNLKLVIMSEYQNIKTFLQKVVFQIGLKKFF